MQKETHNPPVGANCLQVVFRDCKVFLVCRGYLVPEVMYIYNIYTYIFENLAMAVDKVREMLAPPNFSIQNQYSIPGLNPCIL